MNPKIVPAGDDFAVVVGIDSDEPIVIHDVRCDPWPYSHSLASFDPDQAEAVARALLDASEVARSKAS